MCTTQTLSPDIYTLNVERKHVILNILCTIEAKDLLPTPVLGESFVTALASYI